MDGMTGMRIVAEREGAVLTLTIDYPAKRNALAVPLRTELEQLLEAAQSDGTRCIVLTGGGGVFSAGGDISGMNVENALEGRERMRRTHRLVRLMARGNVPIIAAVEGWAAGAGCSLALLCDHVVAAEDARFVLGFHKIGLMADLALPHTLPARVGLGRARDMMLFHTAYNGVEACSIGLVDTVAPKGGALAAAQEKARALAAEAPLPIAYMKQWFSDDMEAALAREADFQAALFATADHKEGREAFLSKRKPVFHGR
jgi:enoyl-CoA hydratase/carnithine racemase